MAELELHDKVVLASGKQFKCDYLTTIPNGFMFIAIHDSTPAEIAQYFTQPSETASITYGEHILENYVFVGMQKETELQYKVMLRRAYVGEV
jgi:hypothetical protein